MESSSTQSVRETLSAALRDANSATLRLDQAVQDVAAQLETTPHHARDLISEVATIEPIDDGYQIVRLSDSSLAHDGDTLATIRGTGTPELARSPGKKTAETFESLPIREDIDHPLVPQLTHQYYERTIGESGTKDVEIVARALADGDFWVNLVGHAGVGKNVLIRHIAEQTNTPIVRFGASDDITYEDFTGAYAPTEDGDGFEFRYGVGAAAVKYGWWLIVDEINAAPPEIMTALHQVTEEGDNAELLIRETQEVITPHENFRLIGTMNPNYAGTHELNKAFASRAYHVRLEYLSPHLEREILAEKTELDSHLRRQLTLFAQSVRSRLEAGDIRTPITTRHLIQIGRMADIMPLREASKTLLLPYANYNDQTVIDSVIDKYFDDPRFDQ